MFIDAVVKSEGEEDKNVLININKIIMATPFSEDGNAYVDLDVQDLNGVFKYVSRFDVFHDAIQQMKGN